MSKELEERIERKKESLKQLQGLKQIFKNEDEYQKRIDALLDDLYKLMKERD